ncbi:hypothetical protein [Bacillus toyonensis]|uniref:hypothetical protein n=1 Tax=Bacillus toyonensis TaxID=155322 RepID=UPI000BF7D85D|nr:hypothetical protein [Bacillus toyonensis]PGF05253.1 hypothetical protein COM61_02240 [Bacillus toyonensis]
MNDSYVKFLNRLQEETGIKKVGELLDSMSPLQEKVFMIIRGMGDVEFHVQPELKPVVTSCMANLSNVYDMIEPDGSINKNLRFVLNGMKNDLTTIHYKADKETVRNKAFHSLNELKFLDLQLQKQGK